ncbi:ribonuclease E/G [Litorimonas sp. RW-G-Af-16]|uniref:ribonuclease E/G n=1 Tax=Litorimonas sp. RW-G-Af-16 TaxID=3241168 RepID=UPI00390C7080
MNRRAVIEEAIGETRAAVYEGRRLVELYVRRHTREVPHAGDIYTGQVITVDPSVAGVFIEVGAGKPGLLKFSAQKDLPKLTDGMFIDVNIVKAAMTGKGPNLSYAGEASASKIGAVKALSLPERLEMIYPGIKIENAPISVIDEACDRQVAIKGGGSVTFEQTQALLAIDVDKGGIATVLDACLGAAETIAAQLRLRGLGGLIIMDFPNLRQPKQRTTLMKALEREFANDPVITRMAPLSKFGVIEMTRSQAGPSLDSILNDRKGEPTTETLAIRALRRLEREAKLNAGAQFELFVPKAIKIWLDTTDFDWVSRLNNRIGARYTIVEGANVDVKADR